MYAWHYTGVRYLVYYCVLLHRTVHYCTTVLLCVSPNGWYYTGPHYCVYYYVLLCINVRRHALLCYNVSSCITVCYYITLCTTALLNCFALVPIADTTLVPLLYYYMDCILLCVCMRYSVYHHVLLYNTVYYCVTVLLCISPNGWYYTGPPYCVHYCVFLSTIMYYCVPI